MSAWNSWNSWKPWRSWKTSLQRPLPLVLAAVAGTLALACLVCVIAGAVLWRVGIWPGTHRYRAEGPAMEPTIRDGQILVVQDYGSASPQRGDIVVFRASGLPQITLSGPLVERIIGVPGDTIAFTQTSVMVNGKPLVEPYVAPNSADYYAERQTNPLTLHARQYYVLGDNRGDSLDSRSFGPIDRFRIMSKVVSII